MNLYTLGEEKLEVEFKKEIVFINGKEAARGIVLEQLPGKGLLVKVSGTALPAFVHREGSVFFCWVAGETYRLCGIDQDQAQDPSAGHDAGEKALIAPMPGKVVKVLVKAGDAVKRGAKLMIIESMKMETEIAAPGDGVISAVKYGEGEVFREGEVLVEIDSSAK